MNNPVITACMCTGEPRSILDEAGQPMLVAGVVVCPHCGQNPFRFTAKSAYETLHLPDSEGGEA